VRKWLRCYCTSRSQLKRGLYTRWKFSHSLAGRAFQTDKADRS